MLTKIINKIKNEIIWYSKYKFNPTVNTKYSLKLESLERDLAIENIMLHPYKLPLNEFNHFLKINDYSKKYHGGTGLIFIEKCLEHFISFKLLQLSISDIYLDIASGGSPFPEFIQRAVGCKVYKNDLSFPSGISKDGIIGGDATNIPLPNNSINKISLHCSYEHFEGDKDIYLLKEIERLLSPGGIACIIPLYMNKEYLILTNYLMNGVSFDQNAKIIFLKDYKCRHGRFYDVKRLKERVLNNLGSLVPHFFKIEDLHKVKEGLWCQFALLLKKNERLLKMITDY